MTGDAGLLPHNNFEVNERNLIISPIQSQINLNSTPYISNRLLTDVINVQDGSLKVRLDSCATVAQSLDHGTSFSLLLLAGRYQIDMYVSSLSISSV